MVSFQSRLYLGETVHDSGLASTPRVERPELGLGTNALPPYRFTIRFTIRDQAVRAQRVTLRPSQRVLAGEHDMVHDVLTCPRCTSKGVVMRGRSSRWQQDSQLNAVLFVFSSRSKVRMSFTFYVRSRVSRSVETVLSGSCQVVLDTSQ